jgi:hypothetical protein
MAKPSHSDVEDALHSADREVAPSSESPLVISLARHDVAITHLDG